MKSKNQFDIVVVGAGLTGLTAAALFARDGHGVTVVDRDPAQPPDTAEDAWAHWERPGVNQFRQPHLMLPRWFQEVGREFPELMVSLLAGGARRVNMLHLQPERITRGWQGGDQHFDTVAVRRPVLEAALSRLLTEHSTVTLRRGVKTTGLVVEGKRNVPCVRGVRTSAGIITADLVVDAAGRRTPIPGWVRDLNGPCAPFMSRDPGGFLYYSRHFRGFDSRLPDGIGAVLTHYPALSVLTLPCDLGTYCVVLIISARDRAMRVLRHDGAWLAAARLCPVAAPWIASGQPMIAVTPIAGIEDISRSYLGDAGPSAVGIVAIGDAAAATNPSLGRGAAIGAIQACALRTALSCSGRDPFDQVFGFDAALAKNVAPWVDASFRFDRHRVAEMEADAEGVPYQPDDPSWAMTTALLAGAGRDPALARAAARIGAMLALPSDVFSDPGIRGRVAPFVGAPRYDTAGPARLDYLQAVGYQPAIGVRNLRSVS